MNVLIAVISDSYERSRLRSIDLWGRARVTFVGQMEVLEAFLVPSLTRSTSSSPSNEHIARAGRFVRGLLLFIIIGTALAAEVYLVARLLHSLQTGEVPFSFGDVIVAAMVLCLAFGIWVLVSVSLLATLEFHGYEKAKNCFSAYDCGTGWVADKIGHVLFGTSETNTLPLDESDYRDEEWMGRLTYVENSIERNVSDSLKTIQADIAALRERLCSKQGDECAG